jgi:copper chaperone CopZ
MRKKLSIEGMTCGHCVKRVAKIIEKAPGVSGVQVSLENKEALFTCDPSVTNVADIVKAIHEFGFSVAEKA